MTAPCRHRHTGFVTNQPDALDQRRPLASIYVCDRDECRTNAVRWVAGKTNEPATFIRFPGRPELDIEEDA